MSEASISSVCLWKEVSAPRPSRTASMVLTSFMRGTLCKTVLPRTRSAAAASFRAAFFAPETSTSPRSRAPPSTRKRFILGPSLVRSSLPAHSGVCRYYYAPRRLRNGYTRITFPLRSEGCPSLLRTSAPRARGSRPSSGGVRPPAACHLRHPRVRRYLSPLLRRGYRLHLYLSPRQGRPPRPGSGPGSPRP